MASLKLLADDLTGALDTAAEFVGLFGPLPVVWPATSLAQDVPSFVIDSRLRGPWVAELEACLATGAWDACILAPAFPYQGRRTFEGRQYVRAVDGGWSAAGDDILRQLYPGYIQQRSFQAELIVRWCS